MWENTRWNGFETLVKSLKTSDYFRVTNGCGGEYRSRNARLHINPLVTAPSDNLITRFIRKYCVLVIWAVFGEFRSIEEHTWLVGVLLAGNQEIRVRTSPMSWFFLVFKCILLKDFLVSSPIYMPLVLFRNLWFLWPFPSPYWDEFIYPQVCLFTCVHAISFFLSFVCLHSLLLEELFFAFRSLHSVLSVFWNIFFEMRDIVILEVSNCSHEHCCCSVVRDDRSCWQSQMFFWPGRSSSVLLNTYFYFLCPKTSR